MIKVSIFGTGYVGLVTGATLADMGHKVTCFDVDKTKIELLESGSVPFYEPGLESLIAEGINNKRLVFSLVKDIENLNQDFHFIAVGTPENSDGSANLKYINSVLETINSFANEGSTIIIKSTVPIGTNRRLKSKIRKKNIDIASNPEFLREGSAVNDSLNPDRVIIGAENQKTSNKVRKLYRSFEDKTSILEVSLEDAELIKYAANSFLATKISFMNEMSRICDSLGASIKNLKKGMTLDPRINDSFMDAGSGYGGSCFPKDLLALKHSADERKVSNLLLEAVDKTNDIQKTYLLENFQSNFKESFKNKNITILGLAFKPNTDDIREAPSIEIVKKLHKQGSNITVYDPKAMDNFKIKMDEIGLSEIMYANTKEESFQNAQIVILVTEWPEFINSEQELIKIKNIEIVMDGRNIWNPKIFEKQNIIYKGVGQ